MEKYFEHLLLKASDLQKIVDQREGEMKLGEKVALYSSDNDNWKSCKYHILGVAESIGPQLNKGLSGAENGYEPFLTRFLNIQSNRFLVGDTICLHGKILPVSEIATPEPLQIEELDQMIATWASMIVKEGGVPIVVGGGHNNALGLINGASSELGKAIAVTNLDPHADVRVTEKRHSGNSFSTAYEQGTLENYFVLGLHQSYNNSFILSQLEKMRADVYWFEDWIDEADRFRQDVESVAKKLETIAFGLELDMDSIAFMPSSAFTPSGVTVEQARFYIRRMARNKKVCYLHLPEAAPSTNHEDKLVGKTLAYLVSDFIKCNSNV